MDNTKYNSLFRENIISALNNTFTDEELKKELHKLVCKEIDKEKPFLLKKTDKKKNLH